MNEFEDLHLQAELAIIESIDIPTDRGNAQAAKKNQSRSTAKKLVSRVEARRARSEARLAELIPPEIPMGESWHLISDGDIDSVSYLGHILKTTDLDYVLFSTWAMNIDDIQRFKRMTSMGKISRIDGYVGENFPGTWPEAFLMLCDLVSQTGGRVSVNRNHAKLYLMRKGNKAWVVESSANINTNPRIEQTVITGSLDLFETYKSFFDKLDSMTGLFHDWTPMDW